MKDYDLIVIGSGSGGGKAAVGCAKAGWKVAVIDKQPFGGTCAQRGCDPKKILVSAAEIIERARMMRGKGISSGAKIEWKELMRFKRSFTEPVAENVLKKYSELGIDAYQGTARFVDKMKLEVESDKQPPSVPPPAKDGMRHLLRGNFQLMAKKILLACGNKPAELGIPGEEHLITSTDFLELHELPKSILLVGGGYIAMEFAHIVSAAGATIRIIQSHERLLMNFDKDITGLLMKSFSENGIKIHTGTKVSRIEKKENSYIVHADNNGKEKSFKTELVIHAAGRVPDTGDLELELSGVRSGKRGITVNEFMQSVSNPDVYAAGDCAAAEGSLPLTPVAGKMGSIVLENLLHGNKIKAEFGAIPTVVFTFPPLASVGILEEDAKKKGLKFKTNFQNSSEWYSSKRIGLKNTGTKVLTEEGTNKILGAHLLHYNADELVNIFAIAIKHGLTSGEMKEMIYTYPTGCSDIQYMM